MSSTASPNSPAPQLDATSQSTRYPAIVILDFGSQYSELIARRVRETEVFSLVMGYTTTAEELRGIAPRGIILSGGPSSVYEPGAPVCDPAIWELGIPVLGVCYGMQLMVQQLGGSVVAAGRAEYGKAPLHVDDPIDLLTNVEDGSTMWMSHGDSVERLPEGFLRLAHTNNTPEAAVADHQRRLYGVQFHPEVVHSTGGMAMLRNFVYHICGCEADWTTAAFIDEAVADVRAQVGDKRVLLALSGGVDSSLIAVMSKAKLQNKLTAFSIGYEGGAWQDETGLAKEFADKVGIQMHVGQMNTNDVVNGFADVCFKKDDPIADLTGSSYYAVMKMAREHGVPVMLMGHGGDELFWGYKWQKDAAIRAERREKLLRGDVGLASYLRISKPPISWTAAMTWLEHGGGLLSGLQDWRQDKSWPRYQLPCWDPHHQWRTADALAPVVLDCWEEARQTDPTAIFRGEQFFPRTDISLTKLVSETYMTVNGIAQGDRLSMATSVECRLPLVDYRLIETVIGLRKARPDHHLPPKAWLHAASKDIVPSFVFERRKRGFAPPWRRWHQAIFDRHISDLRNGALVQAGIVRRGSFDAIRSIHDWCGRPTPLLIPMLVLECWAQGMTRAAANAPRPYRAQ